MHVRFGRTVFVSQILIITVALFAVFPWLVEAYVGDRQHVYPEEVRGTLHNPYMGWIYIDNAIPRYVDAGRSLPHIHDGTAWGEVTNVAVLSAWGALEPAEGEYDWTLLDQAIDFWAAQGKTIHLRISTDPMYIPSAGFVMGPPSWLLAKGIPTMTRLETDTTPFWPVQYPDYRNPLYFTYLERFLRALAEHVMDMPVETVDLRGYGTWGEWHSGHDFASLAERRQVLTQMVDSWVKAFRQNGVTLMLSGSYEWRPEMLPDGISINQKPPPDYRQFVEASAFDYALGLGSIGLRRDGIAGFVYDQFDGRLIHDFYLSTRRPFTSEISGGYQIFSPLLRNRPGYTPRRAVDEALAYHSNYIHTMGWDLVGFLNSGQDPNADGALFFYNKESQGLMQYALQNMGYRLVIAKAELPRTLQAGQQFSMETSWENRAVGRLYHKHRLGVYLVRDGQVVWQGIDTHFDPTYMIAGERYDVVSTFCLDTIPAGEYELLVAVVDDQDQPAIQLAIAGDDGQHRYRLGSVRVENTPVAGDQLQSKETAFLVTPGNPLQLRASELGLHSGGTYIVSFRYEPIRAPYTDVAALGSYGFVARSPSGGELAQRGLTTWRDESGAGPAVKTIPLQLADNSDYELVWQTSAPGTIRVSDIRIKPVDAGAWYEDFTAEDEDSYAFCSPHGTARTSGDSGVRMFRFFDQKKYEDEDHVFLRNRPEVIAFAPNSSYTVSFRVRQATGHGFGSYLYAQAISPTAGKEEAIGFRWMDPLDGQSRRKTFTFSTGNHADYRLDIGVHNGGGAIIDNILVIKND